MNLTPSLHTRYSLGTDKVTRLDAFRRLFTGIDAHDINALPLHTQQHKPWAASGSVSKSERSLSAPWKSGHAARRDPTLRNEPDLF